MSATVVEFSGGQEAAESRGTLFEDKKFWLAQRIPSRSHYGNLITNNGGKVVPLEKQADILIADHARKDAPPGSISWTYIDKSVKNGRLEDPEDHPAGPPTSSFRPVSSARPIKGTRKPFTVEDDRQLAAWVTRAERKGLYTSGNEIYQQLEAKNPRHTFQSWRDRWVKYLQYRERPDLSSEGDGPVDPRRLRATQSHRGNARVSERVARPSPSISQQRGLARDPSMEGVRPLAQSASNNERGGRRVANGAAVAIPQLSPSSLTANNPFTEADTQLLLEMYNDIEQIDPVKLIDAWNALARKYQKHDSAEWYKFWMEVVRPLGPPKHRKPMEHADEEMQMPRSTPPQSSLGEPSSPKRPEQRSRRPHQSDSQRVMDPKIRQFERNLCELAAVKGVPVDLEPVVCGRRILLWDLYQHFLDLNPTDLDSTRLAQKWAEIAKRLGFDVSHHYQASRELVVVWQTLLFDYLQEEEARYKEFTNLQDILDTTGSLTAKQLERYQDLLGDNVEESPVSVEDDETLLPSSPPALPLAAVVGQDQHASPFRRKVVKAPGKRNGDTSRALEIPSTPPQTHDRTARPLEEEFERVDGQHSARRSPKGKQRASEPQQPAEEIELAEEVDRYIALGYPEDIVKEAFFSTTLTTGDVAIVMEALMHGAGIPNNIQGVWTSRDDKALGLPENSMEYGRILTKHGQQRIEKRRIFLNEDFVKEWISDRQAI